MLRSDAVKLWIVGGLVAMLGFSVAITAGVSGAVVLPIVLLIVAVWDVYVMRAYVLSNRRESSQVETPQSDRRFIVSRPFYYGFAIVWAMAATALLACQRTPRSTLASSGATWVIYMIGIAVILPRFFRMR
ncbi:MAG TPA: hypothetical protein VGM51_08655 [Armatimonadota bacterium]|jgi:hypothetical protein